MTLVKTMNKSLQQTIALMYHGIVSEKTLLPDKREAGAELYDVTLANFKDQMQWLKTNRHVVNGLNADVPISEGQGSRVILTFDDGEMNNYTQALPALKEFGFPAYFFIIAKFVGRQGYMGWDELRALHDAGMVIGSHGFSHEILTSLLDTQIVEELSASKKYLEKNLNIKVNVFSIPRGFCDDKVVQMAYDAGYEHVFISERPRAMKSACFSRIAVKSHWLPGRFARTLEGNVSFIEWTSGMIKRIVKRVFGSGIYHWVRRILLRIN